MMAVDVSSVITLFVYFLLFLILLFISVCVFLYVSSTPEAKILRYDEEKYFKNPVTDDRIPCPSLFDRGSVDLSVIVPAFDEEKRLPQMLDESISYLQTLQNHKTTFTYEIIIVDDGSRDKTTETALKYSKKHGPDKIRVLTLIRNRGKGGAVKLGLFSSRGRYLLFADADGATRFSDLSKLQHSMESLVKDPEVEEAIVVGSRAHLEKESIAQRSLFRTILMYGFHFLVWFLCVRNIKDTQCGFKLLTRQATRSCFDSLHIERWAFDVELLYIAQKLKIKTDEVAVKWTEIEGSKVVPFWSWLQMGRDLFLIWLRYKIGAWRIKKKVE